MLSKYLIVVALSLTANVNLDYVNVIPLFLVALNQSINNK